MMVRRVSKFFSFLSIAGLALAASSCRNESDAPPPQQVSIGTKILVDQITPPTGLGPQNILEGTSATFGGQVVWADAAHSFPSLVSWNFADGTPAHVLCDNSLVLSGTVCSVPPLGNGYCSFAAANWTCSSVDSHIYLDSSGSGAGPNFTYNAAFHITTALAQQPDVTRQVIVNNAPPDSAIATISCPALDPFCNAGDSTQLFEGAAIEFTGIGTDPGLDPIARWQWDFGDGTVLCFNAGAAGGGCLAGTTPGAAIAHTYVDQGVYTARFTACDQEPVGTFNCDVTPASQAISVQDIEPILTAGIVGNPNPVNEGSTVSFTASFLASAQDKVVTCQWDFGDGSPVVDDTTNCPGTGASGSITTTASHSYQQQSAGGQFVVTLTIVDEDLPDTVTTLSFENVLDVTPTIAGLSATNPTNEGSQATFSADIARGSVDNADLIVSCTWNPGDGSGAQTFAFGTQQCGGNAVGPNSVFTHTYVDENNYTTTLVVHDEDSDSLTGSVGITINDVNPTIAQLGNGGPVTEGNPVNLFANIATGAADGTSDPISFCHWDPDGAGAIPEQVFAFGTPECGGTVGLHNSVFTFTYTNQNSFLASLTLDDEELAEATASTVVVVNDALATIAGLSTNSPRSEGTVLTATATIAAGSPSDLIVSCTWDPGDGTGAQTFLVGTVPCPVSGVATFTHTYTVANNPSSGYTLSLSVTDEDSTTGPSSSAVTINDVSPVFTAGLSNDSPKNEGATVTFTADVASFNAADLIVSCTWDPGDGTGPFVIGVGGAGCSDGGTSTFTHVYDSLGAVQLFTARLTVTDEDSSTFQQTTVTIDDVNPSISALTNNGPQNEGSPTRLTATVTAGTATDAITSCTWNPGDGTGPQTFAFGTPECGGNPANLVANGSFETGDYTGWTLFETPGNPTFGTWGVGTTGQVIPFGSLIFDFFDGINVAELSPNLPTTLTATDGAKLSLMFQNGSQDHRMHQDIALPAGVTTLSWDMNYTSFAGFGASQFLAVTLRDPGTDAILSTLFITNPGDPASIPMTNFSRDISAFAGTTVRLDVEMNVQSNFFPAQFDHFLIADPAASNTAFTHVYADDTGKPFTASLRVNDEDSFVSSTTSVDATNVPPTANAAAGTPANGTEGSVVTFTASFTDPGADVWTCSWDFGDGNVSGPITPCTSASTTTTHVYADQGGYNVTLTVTDDDGGTDSDAAGILIADVNPIVSAIGTTSPVFEGSLTTLTATIATGAADGTSDPITSCTWFPEGLGGPSFGFAVGAPECSVTGVSTFVYSYNTIGASVTFTPVVQVNDEDSQSSNSGSITVLDVNPDVQNLTNNSPTAEGAPVTFSADIASLAPGFDDIDHCDWDPGDGTGVQTFAVGQPECTTVGTSTFVHAYDSLGLSQNFVATLTVFDEDSLTGPLPSTATITDVDPAVSALSSNSPQTEGSAIAFSVTAVSGSLTPAFDNIDHCDWDPGDGTGVQTFLVGTPQCRSTGAASTFAHVYTVAAPPFTAYTATVRIFDEDSSVLRTTGVQVNDAQPSITNLGNGGPYTEGQTATLFADIATGAADGTSDPLSSCTWDPGDGSAPQSFAFGSNECGGFGGAHNSQFTHLYADDNALDLYVASLRVFDEDSSISQNQNVTVTNVAPSNVVENDNSPVPAGAFMAFSLAWADPGADPFRVTINWGDGQNDVILNAIGDTDIATSHIFSQPTNGTPYQITGTIDDGDGGITPFGPFPITVTAVPLNIVSVSTNAPVAENTLATVWVVATGTSAGNLSYSFDWDGDGLFTGPSDVQNQASSFSSFTRTDNQPGDAPVRVNVRVRDSATGNTALSFVDVAWTNEPPVILSALPTGNVEGSPVSIDVTALDGSPLDNAAGFTFDFDWNGNGVVDAGESIAGTTTATGTHTYAVGGLYVVTIRVFDKDGEFAETQATVDVSHVNVPPVGVADGPYTTNEDTTLVVATAQGVLANDTDSDTPPAGLSAQLVTAPTKGTLSLFADGSFAYIPFGNQNGADSFVYRVTDGLAFSANTTATINITPVNDAPVANAQAITTNEDTSVGITLTGSDVELSALTFSVVTGPAKGTLSGVAPNLTYTPTLNANGSDSFTFKANDGALDSAPATVSITITPVNDQPVANADTLSTDEDVPITVPAAALAANDTDADAGTTLTVTAVSGAVNGAVSLAAGNITFTPTANFNGTASFTYTINDGSGAGNATATGTVTVQVNSVNDAPVANNDAVTTAEDTPAVIAAATLLSNDTDADAGDTKTITAVSQGSHGSVALAGTVTYTPALNFNGTDTFTYTMRDAAGATSTATVTMTVTAVNDPPVANADSITTDEDVPVTVSAASLIANDTDPDGPALTITAVAAGSVNGTPVLAAGNITYTPAANFNGTDTFTYTLSDGAVPPLTATGTVTVQVNSVNDAPVANNDAVTTAEDTPAVIAAATLLANDTDVDAGDTKTITAVSQGSHGSVVLAGTVTYTPALNFNGTDSFTYTMRDAAGATSTATVTMTVTAVNDPPVANADSIGTDEDVPVTVSAASLIANDTDPDGPALTITAVAAGSVNGTPVLAGGNITYTPAANFNGTDTFTYTLSDGAVPPLTATGTVTVTVTAVNDAPVAGNDAVTTAEDTPAVIAAATLLANDTDVDAGDTKTITAVSQGNHGAVVLAGTVTYTPNLNFNGTDSFTYTMRDTAGATSTATVTVTVTAVNDAPTLSISLAPNPANEASAVAAIFTVGDPDGGSSGYSIAINWGDGSNQTIAPAVLGANATTHTYADNGTYNISATVTDEIVGGVPTVASLTGSATATETVLNVAPVISAVTASPDPVDEGATVTVTITATDVAGVADPLTYGFDFDGNGTYEVTNATGVATHIYLLNGNYTVPVRVTDGDGGEANKVVVVHVRDLGPTITSVTSNAPANAGAVVTLTCVATDPAGDPLLYEWDFDANGSTDATDTTGVETHVYNQGGSFLATVKVSDFNGNSTTGSVVVVINGPPNVTVALSPTSGAIVLTNDPVLTVTNPTDNDNAPTQLTVFYELSASSDFTTPLVIATANVAAATTSTAVTIDDILTDAGVNDDNGANPFNVDLADDTFYFWRARARDPGGLFGPYSAIEKFFYNPVNDAPTAPVIAFPISGDTVASLTPALVVDNSTDVDDPTTQYTFDVFTDSGLTALKATSGLVNGGGFGTTTWVVTTTLTEDTWYYWHVTAVDPHGATAVSTAGSFFVSLANNAPTTPVILSPLDGATINTATPALTIQNSTDSESDPISYLYEIDVAPNFGSTGYTSAILVDGSNGTAGVGGTTAWSPGTLLENTTYYWRVRGLDPYHGGSFASGSFFVNVTNDPPTALSALSPVGGALVTPQNVQFAVSNATDPDSTLIFVNFFVYASTNTAGQAVVTSSGDIAQTPGQTRFTPPNGKMKGGKQYFWKAVAHDDQGAFGPETSLQNFQTISVGGGDGCSCSTTQSRSASPLLAFLLGGVALVWMRKRRDGAQLR